MMQSLFVISLVILGLYVCIQILHIFSLLYFENDRPAKTLQNDALPLISILVAARNEEMNIIRCLESLDNLAYPKDKYEVLIGNDHSEDSTSDIVSEFISTRPQFKLFEITEDIGKAKGKANVLAQLAHHACGKYFLITDADISAGKYWAREIVSFFTDEKMGLVSGITVVEDDGFMGRMQEVDWMYFMGMLRSFANYGINCTAVGNNMAVLAAAYHDTGGYENLEFSITEDYKLFNEIRKRGWKTLNVMNDKIINKSVAIHQFGTLLHQRKRWLVGAQELPYYWWLIFGIFGMFTPAIIIIFLVNAKLALIIYLIKVTFQSFNIFILQNKLHVRKTFDYLMTYEFYSILISILTMLFFFIPLKLEWKNRTYKP